MNLRRVLATNLNLLPALHALLHESSVSRAARRIGVTQSAMSQSLKQLRELLGDQLLVRHGAGMLPTPYAEQIAPGVVQVLDDIERILEHGDELDLATVQRRFTIGARDLVAVALLPALIDEVRARAPGIDLHIADRLSIEALAGGQLDLIIAPGDLDVWSKARGLVKSLLYRDTWVCLARRGHPQLRGELDLDSYLTLSHIQVAPGSKSPSVVDAGLQTLGHRRRVALRTPYFVTAPMLVARSDLLVTLPRRVAQAFGDILPIQLMELPFELPTLNIAQIWHERYQDDATHRWVRQVIADGADSDDSAIHSRGQ